MTVVLSVAVVCDCELDVTPVLDAAEDEVVDGELDNDVLVWLPLVEEDEVVVGAVLSMKFP